MLGITVAWASCFVAIDAALKDAPPLWLSSVRALLSGGALLIVAALRGDRLALERGYLPLLAVLSFFNVSVALGAMFLAATGVTTGVASVLANAQPLLIVIPAWLLFGERPSPGAIWGLAVAFSGLLLLAGGGYSSGVPLALVAAAGATVGTLLARRLHGEELLGPIAWHFLFGGAVLTAFALAVEGLPTVVSWTIRLVASLGFLSLIGTAWAFVAWIEEARRSSLVSVTAWTFLVPILGLGFGLLLGEKLTLWQGAGATLAGLGLGIVLRNR